MATANFYNKNASNIYAIFPENEHDDFIFDDVKENIYNDLEVYTKKSKAFLKYPKYPKYLNDYYRDASLIGTVGIIEEIAGLLLSVDIEILMRSGYYEGANLDYEINYNIEGVDFDDLSDAWQTYFNVATWYIDMNKGLATIQAKNAVKRLEAMRNELIENVEKILRENCTHILQVSARFSNGETWYSEVKNN